MWGFLFPPFEFFFFLEKSDQITCGQFAWSYSESSLAANYQVYINNSTVYYVMFQSSSDVIITSLQVLNLLCPDWVHLFFHECNLYVATTKEKLILKRLRDCSEQVRISHLLLNALSHVPHVLWRFVQRHKPAESLLHDAFELQKTNIFIACITFIF